MKNVLIINGPNLNLLGTREKDVYGSKSFNDVYDDLQKYAGEKNIELSYFQSNIEGEIVSKIQDSIGKTDFIIINPGALTHYSYSIHDALTAVKIPAVEVHISNIFTREEWRQKSVISPAVIGIISGLGISVYKLALIFISEYCNKK
ncbi:MAG: type II 3-dehydroquinate dehydratase [Actinobacteria bacterium]|nr:type II 3-dehydroquinate dehydratase [Actinomycetota bacterium]MBM3713475.1 type II 3-dehydroquinate dehydratase [Actinomycetota bacterium]